MKITHETAEEIEDSIGSDAQFIAQRERYLVLIVPAEEDGHRVCDSAVFACFQNESDAQAAADKFKARSRGVFAQALVVVADPDLGLGDCGVDLWGDVTALPLEIQQRLEISEEQGFDSMIAVAPSDLDDETMAMLAAIPQPYVRASKASRQYFRLLRSSRDLGVIDCNGMKWSNATTAVVRDGLLGIAMPEALAQDKVAELTVVKLLATYTPTGDEIVAQKRVRGTAPVGDRTAQRYHGLLQALGANEKEFPLPELDKDAKKLVDSMSAEYHRRKEGGLLKATERQIAYAQAIAAKLNLGLLFDRENTSRAAVSAFIGAHVSIYKVIASEVRMQ